MLTIKQISSFCKLFPIYEEIPDKFLDETNVDSYFYHNILDISQSYHRIVRVSKGSNKKTFAFKVFHFCDSKLQQRFILKEEVSHSKKGIESLLDSLGEILKTFDQANKVSQIPLPKPKFEIGFRKAKEELFSHCYKDIIEHLNRQIRLSVRFEKKTRLASFASKRLNNTVINSFLQKLSTWVTAKSNISTRINFLLLTIVTFLRAISICSAFTPDCGYDNSTIFLIGGVFCPNTNCSGKLCLHKKTFESLGSSDHQCSHCASVCQVRNIPFEDQRSSFFWSFSQGVYIFEESIEDVSGDVYCPGEYCLTRENRESLGSYVTTPRSIFGFGKCGAWLIVHRVPFMLQKHVKTTKTDKTRFFVAKNDELVTRQTIVH